jgi:cytochrome c-type biogenesis protein CcmE
MKWKSIIGLVAMAGFAGLLLMNFGNQVSGYMNFEQAADTGSKAHVVGTWVKERPTRYDRSQNVFSFYMKDQTGTVRKVRYPNPKPANFEQAEKVVVEGQMNGQAFAASHILVKCPSKYNDAKGLKKQASRSSSSAPMSARTE